MTEFNQSEWNESDHVQEFVEHSDIYIMERKLQFKILTSFYQHFVNKTINKRNIKVLDLGCGDGRISRELLKVDTNVEIYLVDGSYEMLERAKSYLNDYNNIQYINKTFQDILDADTLATNFDFIVSSLAIHHLSSNEKDLLFNYIYKHLNNGGYFLNMEVVLAPSEPLEEWYRIMWQQWIQENERKLGIEKSFQYLPLKYKKNPDNHPDTLDRQLNSLKTIGFKNVDCHYKYGIFAIYSGER
jgi:tRNA (cmo5U34)-methyltransferase